MNRHLELYHGWCVPFLYGNFIGWLLFFYLIVVTWHFHIMKMLIYASDLSIAFKIIIKAAIMIDTLH